MAAPNKLWQRFAGLLGEPGVPDAVPAPRDARAQIADWVRELKEQLPRIDQTLARIRAELPGRGALIRQVDARIQSVEQQIRAALARDDRAHAGSLAIERERLLHTQQQRREGLVVVEEQLRRMEQLRARYLEAMTLQLREFQVILQGATGKDLEARVAALARMAAEAGAGSLSAKLLQDAGLEEPPTADETPPE